MKRSLPVALVLVVALVGLCGCYWISGPWTPRDRIHDKYEEVEVGMLRSEVEDILGEPSDIVYPTGPDGAPIPDSQEGWLRYKYDYPADPLLITVKLDNFGIVTEKHFDDTDSVAELRETKSAEEKTSYPGAPQQRFQELLKKKQRGQ